VFGWLDKTLPNNKTTIAGISWFGGKAIVEPDIKKSFI
jgi:hypothetical protein